MMKCRSCNTPMVVDRCESSEHATTCWHQCPLCRQVRLTSDPVSSGRLMAGNGQNDDDRTYLMDGELLQVADPALL